MKFQDTPKNDISINLQLVEKNVNTLETKLDQIATTNSKHFVTIILKQFKSMKEKEIRIGYKNLLKHPHMWSHHH